MRLLAGAELVGFMRYRFRDTKKEYIFDVLSGQFSYTKLHGVYSQRIRATDKGGYPSIPIYFKTDEGREVYCKIQLHRIAASLGALSRGFYRAAALNAMEVDGLGVEDITLSINHADLDKHNCCIYNLEWVSQADNNRHRFLAEKVLAVDERGRINILICSCYTAVGGRLRKGIYMSAERNAEAFGKYLENGANGAQYRGEPYSKYMSRQISEANLPADVDAMNVLDKHGDPYVIQLAGRTIWQILADCWAIKVVEVLSDKEVA
jgi:hypothetical protein